MPVNSRGGLGIVAGVLAVVLVVFIGVTLLKRPEKQPVAAIETIHSADPRGPARTPAPAKPQSAESAPGPGETATQLPAEEPLPEVDFPPAAIPEVTQAKKEPPKLLVRVYSSNGEPAAGARVWVLDAKSVVQGAQNILPADAAGGIDPFSGLMGLHNIAANEQGEAAMPIPAAGNYVASAVGPADGAGQSKPFEVGGAESGLTADVILDPPAGLSGFVLTADGDPLPFKPAKPSGLEWTDPKDGSPVHMPSVRVVLQPAILSEGASSRTAGVGEDGSYRFDSLPAISFLASLSGSIPEDWALPPTLWIDRSRFLEGHAEEDFILTRASALLGIVTDPAGEPVGKARVTWQAKPETGPLVRGGSVVTDFDGIFVFDSIPFEPIVLEVGHLNYKTKAVDIGFPDKMDLVVQLEPLPAIEGFVVMEEGGDPVAGATVRIEPVPGSEALPRTGGSLRTKANGWFSFQVSGGGGVTIRAAKDDAGLAGELRIEDISDYMEGGKEVKVPVRAVPSLLLQIELADGELRMPRKVTYTLLKDGKPSRIGMASLDAGGQRLLVGGLTADRIVVTATEMRGEALVRLPGQQAVTVTLEKLETPAPAPQ